jgi:F-box-like
MYLSHIPPSRLFTSSQMNHPPVSVEDLFLCNDPIPDALLQKIQHEHAQLGPEIDSIQQEIEALKAKKETLLCRKEALKGVLGPIRNVPNEIISQILLDALQHPLRMRWDDRQDLSNLRRVSKRWNDVALGTPMLWRAWEGGSRESLISAPLFIPKLVTLFSRGGVDAPLRLSVHSWIQDDDANSFVAFITGSWAWEELILTLSASTWKRVLSRIRSEEHQSLKTIKRLSIRIYDSDSESPPLDVDLRGRLPSLDFLLIYVLYKGGVTDAPLVNVRHSKATSFAYGRASISHSLVRNLISNVNSCALKNLVLDNLSSHGHTHDIPPPNASPIILPNIERVVTRGSTAQLAICNFTFPHLQSLQVITGKSCHHGSDRNVFCEFLQRSTFELKVLSLEQSHMISTWDLGSYIKHTRSCQVLRVDDGGFFPTFRGLRGPIPLHLSTIVSSKPFFIEAGVRRFDYWVLEGLRDFLRFQRSTGEQLDPLTILTPEPLPFKKIGPNEAALLERLDEEGLVVLHDSRGLGDSSISPYHWDFCEIVF